MIPIIKAFFRGMRNSLGKKPELYLLALAWTVVACIWIGDTGNQFSGPIMAAIMVMITIGAVLLPNQCVEAFRHGHYFMAFVAALGSCLFLAGEMIGHSMAVSGIRGADMHEATMKQAAYKSLEADLARMQKRLTIAQDKLAEQSKYGSPESYNALIASQDKIAELEGAKGKRGRGACREKCDAALKLAAKYRAEQAIAIDREQNTRPLVNRLMEKIENAQQNYRAADAGFSKSMAHAEAFAKVVYGSVEPTSTQVKQAEHMIETFTVVLITLGGALLYMFSQQTFEHKERGRFGAWLRYLVFGGDKPKRIERVSHPLSPSTKEEPATVTVQPDPLAKDRSPVPQSVSNSPDLPAFLQNDPKRGRFRLETLTAADLMKMGGTQQAA